MDNEPFKMEVIKKIGEYIPPDKTLVIEDKVNAIMSSAESQEGNSTVTDYTRDFLNSMGTIATFPVEKKATAGNGLISTMKNNTDALSGGMNEIAKVMHNANTISDRNVTAVENLGHNINTALSVLTTVLNIGNLYKNVSNQLTNHHGNVQSQTNFKKIDDMDFNSNGHLGLVDSKNRPIKPREVKALHNAESADNIKFSNIGSDSVTDTDGKKIIPREVNAVKDAEQAIETKEMNESTITEELGFLDEFFMGCNRVSRNTIDH